MIVPLREIAIKFAPGQWPAPPELRAKVPAIWARLKAETPQIWDGRILGVSGPDGGPPDIVDGVLRGVAREDAFSAFLAWRELGFPEIGVRNVFGSAIIVSSDDAILLGEMAGTTANAGKIYPPGGSLEPGDIRPDGLVDVFGSIARELTEETGLRVADARVGQCWAIFDGPRISLARFFHFDRPADALRAEVSATLDRQAHRELADVVIVRSPDDLRGRATMPYVLELLAAFAMRTGELPDDDAAKVSG